MTTITGNTLLRNQKNRETQKSSDGSSKSTEYSSVSQNCSRRNHWFKQQVEKLIEATAGKPFGESAKLEDENLASVS